MVTVAIPVRNGMRWLPGVLDAIAGQRLEQEIEVLACDSGSSDGSRELLVGSGARVIDIAPGTFGHASARNQLMAHARGEFVAMISQDAEPAAEDWLARLLGGFDLADDVALVYGPYLPRPDCPPREAMRLARFFDAMSPGGEPRLDRLHGAERALEPAMLIGPRGYFTDANGCVRRDAWRQVPYPDVPYAEDHALAVLMLRAGYAKVFEPRAGILHSHHHGPVQQLQRTFDDWRGLLEIYGWREPIDARHLVLQLRGAGGPARRRARSAGASRGQEASEVLAAVGEQVLRLTGAVLGSRADRLPAGARRRLSLEGRETVVPLAAVLAGTELGGAPGLTTSDTQVPGERRQTPSARAGGGSAWR